MERRIVSILIAVVISFTFITTTYAHERETHDKDIEYVLFGDEDYKSSHPITKSIITAIEDATYLCVDQFNGNGKKELDNLNKEKIPGIPKSIDEFDFNSNYAHRNFTHRGWNVSYSEAAHWPIRQKILFNTVNKELFADKKNPISWLSDVISGENNEYRKQCESFCVLLYYVHILGDHIEAGDETIKTKTLQQKLNGLAYIDPLTRPNDRDNPGIIPDLMNYCAILFKSQEGKREYDSFMQELDYLKDKSDRLVGSKGGVDTEAEFEEYNKCANDLRSVLGDYVPRLLENEDFYKRTFL